MSNIDYYLLNGFPLASLDGHLVAAAVARVIVCATYHKFS